MRSIHHIIYKYHNPSTYLLYGSLGLTVLSGFILSSSATYGLFSSPASALTQAASSRASVTVSSTCSMTATVNTEHNATLINGMYSGNDSNYNNGIGKTTIQTFCNDAGGYAIYAVGFGNNEVGSNKLHSNVLGSSYDIATGTATSGDTSNWSMKVAALTGTIDGVDQAYAPAITNNYDKYSPVPTSYTKVARFDGHTNAETIGSSITTTYAAYISQTQPAGTYVGQVKYALVHPGASNAPESFIMQNVADWKETLLVGEEIAVTDARDGKTYTVARLCTKVNYDSTSGQYEAGTCAPDDSESEIWMTQNLDLTIDGNDTSGNPLVLTSNNTDLNTAVTPEGNTMKDYSTDGVTITWAPGSNIHTATEITYPATSGSGTVAGWTNTYTDAYQAEGVNASGNEMYNYQGTKYAGLSACEAANHTEAQCQHYHVGNYYNWTAAVAMSYSGTTTNEGGSTYFDDDKYVMPNSICPKGWRLPNGLTKDGNDDIVMSDFNKLLKAQGITGTSGKTVDNAIRTDGIDLYGSTNVGFGSNGFNKIGLAPLYFVRSGGLAGSVLGSFGTGGYYWSSTVISPTDAFNLNYRSGELYPAGQDRRYGGRSVRCIAR